MRVLTFDNVWKVYDGDVVAVQAASFTSKQGEFLALLGPSGCGKSTTMRMIAGLEQATKGQIKIDGHTVNTWSPARRNVALSFESYALYAPLTVRGNIEFPLRARKIAAKEREKRLQHIIKVFEIADLLDRMPSELSGGQAQRVSLARALVRNPDVLLLDEPLSHLDYQLRTTMRMRIRHLHDMLGATTIYVTHDQEEAVALADRIIVMNHAEIQQIGDVHSLWHDPLNMFVAGFLGDPAMNFIQATCTDNVLRTCAGTLPLPATVGDTLPIAVTLGFRPEYVSLSPYDTPSTPVRVAALCGHVLLNEFQGERCVITVQTDAGMVKVVESSTSVWQAGDKVSIVPHMDKIHFFDTDTGDAITWRP